VPCPAGTFKDVHGDSPSLCMACSTAPPNKTGLEACPASAAAEVERLNDIPWALGTALISSLVVVLVFVSWRIRRRADAVWMVQESELTFGNPVEILGRGTFGWVVKAEYRGTSVAVKRVLPPASGDKFDWEMDFERNITGSSTGTVSTQEKTPASKRSSHRQPTGTTLEQLDVETGEIRPRTGLVDLVDADDETGFRTLRRLPSGASSCSRLVNNWSERYRLRKDFIREMRALSKMRHPCVTTVMGAVISTTVEPMLIMELMEHGSLYDILHNDTVAIENELVLPILCDIAQGLRFLHAAKPVVVHGDLKAQNVLVDARFRAKVSDFGLSQKQKVGACGTPYWMAPELLRGASSNTPASDMYSFGILLNEVCTRQDPYAGEDPKQVLRAVMEERKRPDIPKSCCADMEVLMRDCWHTSPEMRPTSEELDRRLRSFCANSGSSPLVNWMAGRRPRQEASEERAKRTDDLLYDVFPRHVADALTSGQKVEPESREVVTIFFSDIVGFTDIAATLEPRKVSCMLDRLYTKFDALSSAHGVFKVETIGDAYMAVSNIAEDQHDDHAKRIAEFAMAAIEAAKETQVDLDDPSRGYINIRVGFHSGPVVASVVGTRNLRYCLFGDTVNTASRMESNSIKNHIHCSARAAQILRQQAPQIPLVRRGLISVKGKGEMETYWVAKEPP